MDSMKDLDYFFYPKSVAVIGASRDKGSIGWVELENFVKGNFKGKVYAVNPKAKKILGVKCHNSVLDIKNDVDLAVITVPSNVVPKVLKECSEKKVKAVILISAGFAEIGEKKLTKEVQEIIDNNPKMRVIGPNVLGVLHEKEGVDALFNPPYMSERPPAGNIAFISQSGALGAAILDWAGSRNYGISKFISYGNAMDVDESDLLEYLGEDKDSNVIAMYIEGVRDGRKFFKVAKKVAKKKPVIFIKGGITQEAAASTQSHTGSLAGDVEVYKALIKQSGIIHATSMKEVFDYAKIFSNEPFPKSKRVQIITNGGGFGVLSTDAVLMNKLKLAKMKKETKKKIEKASPKYAVVKNPCDLTGDADNKRYEIALKAALQDSNIDSIILIVLFQVPTITESIDNTIIKILKTRKKPVLVMSAGGHLSAKHKKNLEMHGLTTFSSPFVAANALSALTEYSLRYKVKPKK